MSDKGFTVWEMLFVLSILSICTLVMLNYYPKALPLQSYVRYIKEQLLQAQIRSIYERTPQTFFFQSGQLTINDTIFVYPSGIHSEQGSFHFNEEGSISRAGTVCFFNQVQKMCMILELGSGRIVLR